MLHRASEGTRIHAGAEVTHRQSAVEGAGDVRREVLAFSDRKVAGACAHQAGSFNALRSRAFAQYAVRACAIDGTGDVTINFLLSSRGRVMAGVPARS